MIRFVVELAGPHTGVSASPMLAKRADPCDSDSEPAGGPVEAEVRSLARLGVRCARSHGELQDGGDAPPSPKSSAAVGANLTAAGVAVRPIRHRA